MHRYARLFDADGREIPPDDEAVRDEVLMLFLIWSIEHNAWWRPMSLGYTQHLSEAGRYTEEFCRQLLPRANLVSFNECMIPETAVDPTSATVGWGDKREKAD